MKTATQAYKAQMKKLLRNHSYVGVAFGNVDVTAGSDSEWQGNKVSWSNPKTLNFDHDYTTTAATLEPNRWHLDGSQVIRQTDGNYGWVGNALSNASGVISYTMTRDFNVLHAVPGITITFDSVTGEYPTSGSVTFTNEDGTETSASFAPTSPTVQVELPSDSLRSVSLTFTGMIPRRRPRVLTTLWGIGYSYTNNEIISCSQSNDVDPLARRLPQEKFSFTIHDYKHTFDPDNPQGMYATINKGAPIKVAYGYELDDGTVEWLKEDYYNLDNKPSFQNSKVTFSGTGLMSTLTGTYYKGVLGNKNFYDMAVDVLEDANLTPSASGGDPWDIDDSLKTMYTTAPLPIATHAECLQMIAHACNCRLYTDDDNIIHLKPFGVTPLGIFSGTLSDNGHAWISSWDNVDFGTPSDTTYVTLEPNRWVLNSPQVIADENYIQSRGYVSGNISNSSGTLSSTMVTKRFDIIHDIPNLVLTFDEVLGEYPKTLAVRYYKEDGTLIGTKNITPTDTTISVVSDYEDCSYFTITATATRIPYRRARIMKVAYFETDYSLTLDLVKQDTMSTTRLDRLHDVYVSQYSYTPSQDSQKSKLYEITTSETFIHAEYQMATNITVSVSGGSVQSSEVYAQAADLELSSGTKTVVIEGIPVNEGSVVYTYNFNSSGEDDIEENKLITNKDMADAHAQHIGEYLNMRNTYDASYRGNPEVETGDIISVQTAYDNVVYGLVLVDGIDFNGALSGKLKIKGLT